MESSSPELRLTNSWCAQVGDSSTPVSKMKPQQAEPSADLSAANDVVLSAHEIYEGGPFPSHTHPSPAACLAARDSLAALHGYDCAKGASNTGLEQAEPKNVKVMLLYSSSYATRVVCCCQPTSSQCAFFFKKILTGRCESGCEPQPLAAVGAGLAGAHHSEPEHYRQDEPPRFRQAESSIS